MRAHPNAMRVQESGCSALWNLARKEDNQLKIASLGGIETVLHAMSAHPKAAQVQESGCFALSRGPLWQGLGIAGRDSRRPAEQRRRRHIHRHGQVARP